MLDNLFIIKMNIYRGEYDKVWQDLMLYKDTLRKMYIVNTDQENFINDLKMNNTDLVVGIDK